MDSYDNSLQSALELLIRDYGLPAVTRHLKSAVLHIADTETDESEKGQFRRHVYLQYYVAMSELLEVSVWL